MTGTGPSGPAGPTPGNPDPGPTGPGRSLVISFPRGYAIKVDAVRWLVVYRQRGRERATYVHRRRAARRLLRRLAI